MCRERNMYSAADESFTVSRTPLYGEEECMAKKSTHFSNSYYRFNVVQSIRIYFADVIFRLVGPPELPKNPLQSTIIISWTWIGLCFTHCKVFQWITQIENAWILVKIKQLPPILGPLQICCPRAQSEKSIFYRVRIKRGLRSHFT